MKDRKGTNQSHLTAGCKITLKFLRDYIRYSSTYPPRFPQASHDLWHLLQVVSWGKPEIEHS
jgi:hypothetical protein